MSQELVQEQSIEQLENETGAEGEVTEVADSETDTDEDDSSESEG